MKPKGPTPERRSRRRRFVTDSPLDLAREDAAWRLRSERDYEARSGLNLEASQRAVSLLRELASRYRDAGLLEVAGFLEARVAIYARVLGPSAGSAGLPGEIGDVDRLRRVMTERDLERERSILARDLPVPDRRQELRRAEDMACGVELAIAGVRRRIDFVLIHSMGDIEAESRALRQAGSWRLADFLAAESFAMEEVFCGRRPPASVEGRLRARAKAEKEALDKGYKD